MDSAPLARGGGVAVTLGRLTWATLRRIHTPADNPDGFSFETAEQVDLLRTQGCDQMQGYYFSRPLPAEGLADMLRDGRIGRAGRRAGARGERAVAISSG